MRLPVGVRGREYHGGWLSITPAETGFGGSSGGGQLNSHRV